METAETKTPAFAKLQIEIARVIDLLESATPGTPAYYDLLSNLGHLTSISRWFTREE